MRKRASSRKQRFVKIMKLPRFPIDSPTEKKSTAANIEKKIPERSRARLTLVGFPRIGIRTAQRARIRFRRARAKIRIPRLNLNNIPAEYTYYTLVLYEDSRVIFFLLLNFARDWNLIWLATRKTIFFLAVRLPDEREKRRPNPHFNREKLIRRRVWNWKKNRPHMCFAME